MSFAAKLGDKVIGKDIHLTKIPSGNGYIIVPMTYPYIGNIYKDTSTNVYVNSKQAATIDSQSIARPSHVAYGMGFARNPDNKGIVIKGSSTVFINGKKAARNFDTVSTCDDVVSKPINSNSKIVCNSTVIIGG